MENKSIKVPIVQFIKDCGTKYTDEKGYGIYLNIWEQRCGFVPCLHPNYFKDFEGKEVIDKYPYVLWFKKEN